MNEDRIHASYSCVCVTYRLDTDLQCVHLCTTCYISIPYYYVLYCIPYHDSLKYCVIIDTPLRMACRPRVVCGLEYVSVGHPILFAADLKISVRRMFLRVHVGACVCIK